MFVFQRICLMMSFRVFKGRDYALLRRNLYGSKTAPKLWYKCLIECLTTLGFVLVAGHPYLFIRKTFVNGMQIIVVIAIFADDLLVTGNDLAQIELVKQSVATRFALTDEGKLEYYLGGELEYKDQNTLVLHQRGYIKKLLERFGMVDCNPKATPLDVDLNLSLLDCPDEVNTELHSKYRELIGSLMFLYQWTRPDLGYAVTFLSRYLHKPGVKHLTQAKNVLRYLKGTQEYGIQYSRDLNRLRLRNQELNTLYALSNSDFGGCSDTARATSGNVILMNAGAIAWYSGRQTTTALCTAMAETIALAKVVVKVKYLRAILFDLQCRQVEPTYIDSTIVWVDNTATLAVANGNDFTHETVKHVTVKVRFLQECVQRKIVLLASIRTHQNIADILTKQYAGPQFRMYRNYILGISDTVDLRVSAMVAYVSRASTRRRRRQQRRKSILARQECDGQVKF